MSGNPSTPEIGLLTTQEILANPAGPDPIAARRKAQEWRDAAQLSVVIIGRNNRDTLIDMLPRLAGEVHQIIYMDTGSTDQSDLIAFELGADVYRTIWQNDFARARNEALSHATGKWILSLDTDEILPRMSARKLNYILHAADPEKEAFWIQLEMKQDAIPLEGDMNVQLRCFPNLYAKGLRWRYRVHEQIIDSLESLGVTRIIHSDVRVRHTGYSNPDMVKFKCARNREMLALEMQEDPPPRPVWITRYHAAKCAYVCGHLNEAIDYARKVAYDEDCRTINPHQAASALRFLGEILFDNGKHELAVDAWKQGAELWPEDLSFPAHLGNSFKRMGQEEEGREWLEKAAAIPPTVCSQAISTTRFLHMVYSGLAHSYALKAQSVNGDSEARRDFMFTAENWKRKADNLIGAVSVLEPVEGT